LPFSKPQLNIGLSLGEFVKRFDGLNLEPKALAEIFHFLPYPFLLGRVHNGVRKNIFVNEKFIEEIGYAVSEIPTIDEWFEMAYPDPQYRREVINEWEGKVRDKKEGAAVTMSAIIKTKRYGYQWYEVTSNFLSDVNVVAFVNIQGVKTQEKLLNEEKLNRDRILSILGHDLRGPLSNLISLSSLFQRGALTQEELNKVIASIHTDASHAFELLDTLLTWTRSNFSRITIKHQLVDIKQLVCKALELFRYAAEAKQIVHEIDIDHSVPFYCDEVILSIVMRNLISNAIKFTPTGGKIKIESKQEDKFITFVVIDSGVGMSEEYIQFITTNQSFSKQGTHREKGFGMGLRLCREFLPLIGGSMEIMSEENKGTTMKVKWPMVLHKPIAPLRNI
jgi:signal transduction histidine kinase